MNMSHAKTPLAVLWDFGGVILSSPFEAFNRYEAETGLPKDFIRSLNARNPDTNAWAKMERSEVSLEGFVALFEEEARQQGHKLDGWRILQSLSGDIRPQMVEALRRCKAAFRVACITNNMKSRRRPRHGAQRREGEGRRRDHDAVRACRGIEQARLSQARSAHLPHACELMGVPPERCVYLDDLGINLKPARALGMRTIKVGDPDVAIDELQAMVGIPLRS